MPVFRFLALLFALLLGVIIVTANLDLAPQILDPIYAFPYGDKIGHFVLMGGLALLVSLGFSLARLRVLGVPLLKGSLVIAALVTVEEASQVFLANRDASLLDLLANYAGIFLLGELGAVIRGWLARGQGK